MTAIIDIVKVAAAAATFAAPAAAIEYVLDESVLGDFAGLYIGQPELDIYYDSGITLMPGDTLRIFGQSLFGDTDSIRFTIIGAGGGGMISEDLMYAGTRLISDGYRLGFTSNPNIFEDYEPFYELLYESFAVQPVPLPAASMMLLSSLGLLAWRRAARAAVL